MSRSIGKAIVILSAVASLGLPVQADAQDRSGNGEPSWTYGIVRTGQEREAIKSLPMTQRPYRPLHFYGNSVRRLYYRGTVIPAPRDVLGAGAATILRQ